MNNQILADYYEEKGLVKKAQRLRKRSSKVIFGWYGQYTYDLGYQYTYGYERGNGWWFTYGSGEGYYEGNGWYFRWQN